MLQVWRDALLWHCWLLLSSHVREKDNMLLRAFVVDVSGMASCSARLVVSMCGVFARNKMSMNITPKTASRPHFPHLNCPFFLGWVGVALSGIGGITVVSPSAESVCQVPF